MHHEIKKCTFIMTEIMTFLMANGAREVDCKFKAEKDGLYFTFTHYNCDYDDEFIEKLQYNLDTQRQYEVEGYYWQLCGEDESGDELYLVGSMVDEAKVEKKNNNLTIHLKRKCECEL